MTYEPYFTTKDDGTTEFGFTFTEDASDPEAFTFDLVLGQYAAGTSLEFMQRDAVEVQTEYEWTAKAVCAAQGMAQDTARLALTVLEEVRGNINPERGFADELEADVLKAIEALRAVPTSPQERAMGDPTLKTTGVTIRYTASDGYRNEASYSSKGAATPQAVFIEAVDELSRLCALFGFGDEARAAFDDAQRRVAKSRGGSP